MQNETVTMHHLPFFIFTTSVQANNFHYQISKVCSCIKLWVFCLQEHNSSVSDINDKK